MSPATVSVVIPCRDQRSDVLEALESVFAQTVPAPVDATRRAELAQIARQDALDGRLGADRHEDRRVDRARAGADDPGARPGLGELHRVVHALGREREAPEHVGPISRVHRVDVAVDPLRLDERAERFAVVDEPVDTAGREMALVQPQRLQDLAAYQAAHQRQAQQQVQLGLGQLGQHALLELHPQARHREEHRGARALQVGRELRHVDQQIVLRQGRRGTGVDVIDLDTRRERDAPIERRVVSPCVDDDVVTEEREAPRQLGEPQQRVAAMPRAARAWRLMRHTLWVICN